MNKTKHLWWSIAGYLLFVFLNYKFNWFDISILLVVIGFFVLLMVFNICDRDILLKVKHRGIMHTPFAVFIFASPFLYSYFFPEHALFLFVLAVAVGLGHLLLDKV